MSRYCITASGLPAVLIKLGMSGISTWLDWEPFRWFELLVAADMAESIDEFRGAPFAGSLLGAAGVGPAMLGNVCDLGKPTLGVEFETASDPTRPPFVDW